MLDPRDSPVVMTLQEAVAEIGNAVYAATDLYERLEGAGLINGNGHHMRQKVADFAQELLRQRWLDEEGRM